MKMRMWVGPRLKIGSVVRAGVRVESLLLCARQDGPSESEVVYLSSPFRRKKKRERGTKIFRWHAKVRLRTSRDEEREKRRRKGTRRERMEGK